jgi:LmbE family N-acetylglucosaminyl deacetylase
MKLHKPEADTFVPDDIALADALARTTHLGVGAHQDDLEIMALHGILECFGKRDAWFSGVTCTNGSGSARTGVYADYTDEEMTGVRLQEQRAAAMIGRYAAMLQLGYSSKELKDTADDRPVQDLVDVLRATRPRVVYTHNPADKHATHVAVLGALLKALGALAPEERPAKVYACEVWRDLDWVPDARKVVLDVSDHPGLSEALVGVYDSQVAGGKRYDLASVGRRRANATYLESHATDKIEQASFALDLTPVVSGAEPDVVAFVDGLIREFRDAVQDQFAQLLR